MRLIAYIRVSTEEQANQGHSLVHQLERLRAYCISQSHELVDVIADEGVSGSMPIAKRAGGALLIEALRSRRGQGVVIIRLDRLFRNALDGLRFFEEEITTLDASVFSLAESIDTSTPAGWLSLIMQLACADYARRLDVQRGKETNRSLREQGKVYGNIPFGCMRQGGTLAPVAPGAAPSRLTNVSLVREPETWRVRECVVQLRNAGNSYGAISVLMRQRGIASPSGARTWSKSTIKNICETHESLCHLPMAEQGSAAMSTFPETKVSAHATH